MNARHYAPALSLAMALLLSACVTPPDLGPRPAPASSQNLPSERSLAAPHAAWPAKEWWKRYQDPQLDRLISQALSQSPTMAVAQARIRRAQAGVQGAGAALYPHASLTGGMTEAKPSTQTGAPVSDALRGWNDSARTALDFSYEFDFWGKNRALLASAVSELSAAQADGAAAGLSLSTAIATVYADLLRLYNDRDMLQEVLRIREESERLVRMRFDAGYDSEADLRQAQAGPPAVRAELAASEEQIGLAHFRLTALLGAGPDAALEIERPARPALQAIGLPPSLPADLLGRRPDLTAARWRVEALSSQIDAREADFYPNINLSAMLGLQSLGVGNLFRSGSDFGSVGAAFSLPIFDAGRRKAAYGVARADYDAAVANYDAALAQALNEIAGIALNNRSLDEQIHYARESLRMTERAWELARARYTSGAADFQSVLIVEDRLATQKRVVAALDSRRFAIDVALHRALGGGFQEATHG
ncbi:efflux transporter outer membrane subunit [Achromobacter pestifer]|uniref:Efflux transporter outer membrane subunit n=1 Tax=Achromobacter pestifer TaxID=1353889 RepID=A0A7D4HX55_9BURK|nr:efflux transporter outer membrane subunit [Achromobacter pestifer]QKH38933.1 efflux transporter outer membrane subunit [Achromobacter pestifer]